MAPQIAEAAKVWVVELACRKPKDLGLAAELWTISALAEYVAAQAGGAGFARLSQAGKATVWRILNADALKPHRVRHYLKRRDAQFERKAPRLVAVGSDRPNVARFNQVPRGMVWVCKVFSSGA